MKIMKSSKVNIIYLLICSPQFGPVELSFWIFWKKFDKSSKVQLGATEKVESFNIIKSALSCINKDKINDWFRHFYKVVKDEINQLSFSWQGNKT